MLFISLFLFVSCDELPVEDPILNYKGGVVVYKSEGKNEWNGKWKMKVRIKENGKNGEHYFIKTLKTIRSFMPDYFENKEFFKQEYKEIYEEELVHGK